MQHSTSARIFLNQFLQGLLHAYNTLNLVEGSLKVRYEEEFLALLSFVAKIAHDLSALPFVCALLPNILVSSK